MKLYALESLDHSTKNLEEFNESDLIYSTLSLIESTEERLTNDFINAYTTIDMLSLIGDKVTQIESSLISEPIASKNYLTIYSLNEDFIKAINKNLGCQKPIVSLEDYRLSIDKKGVHEITMEGLKDILITIWEKIKAFFKKLYEKIILFIRRLIGLEPQFNYLEKYIEHNIAKIKSRNLILANKSQKVETNIVKYLAPYDVGDFNEDHIWRVGIPKINAFINLIEDMIKYSKIGNEPEIINAIKASIDKNISNIKRIKGEIDEIYTENFSNIKPEEFISNLSNITEKIETISSEKIPEISQVIKDIITSVLDKIKTDELLATIFGLNNVIPVDENPYPEVTTAIEMMEAKIKVESENELIIRFIYRPSTISYTTPNILNLNVFSVVGNGLPQSDIMFYSRDKESEQGRQTSGTPNENERQVTIKYKYSDYGVVKYPNTNINSNLFYAISDINNIDKLFALYKKIKNLPVANVIKNIEATESRLASMTKSFDEFIKILDEISETLIKINGIISAYVNRPENKGRTSDQTQSSSNEVLDDLLRDKFAGLKISRINLIKLMEYHRRNLTNSAGKVMAELISIRANFLRDLGYYIYRSTEKYS